MKKLSCLMTAFIVFILQSSVLPFVCDGITQPNLVFLFVVLMALHHGQRVGVVTALIGGVCQDVVIGNFLGLHLLPYLVIAFACSYIGRGIDKDQWILTELVHLLPYLVIAFACSYIGRGIDKDQWILTELVVLGATECCLILTCAVLFISGQFINGASYLFEFSIPMLAYHGILALPVDRVVWRLRRDELYYGHMGYRW